MRARQIRVGPSIGPDARLRLPKLSISDGLSVTEHEMDDVLASQEKMSGQQRTTRIHSCNPSRLAGWAGGSRRGPCRTCTDRERPRPNRARREQEPLDKSAFEEVAAAGSRLPSKWSGLTENARGRQAQMSRRKSEITGHVNERDFPHIVEIELPTGDFRNKS
jgi:hypothetical protein